MNETTSPTTCTVRSAFGPCADPAVQIVVTPSGERFAECARHASPAVGRIRVIPVDDPSAVETAARAPFAPGDHVVVEHVGVAKVAVVVAVRVSRADVRVPLADGSEKVITRAFGEIEHGR